MKTRCLLVAFLVFALILGFSFVGAQARDYGSKKGHSFSLEEKFFHKAQAMFINQEELGLSDEQVEKIKDLKLQTKKDLIEKKSEIEVIAVDIKAALWGDVVDTKAINKLIDKKYELKKSKAKALVEAYAALKSILTDEQKQKMKSLWKKSCTKKK